MLNGRCQQICTNEVGSFSCSCTEGYELQMDNIRCQGELATPYKLIGYLENYQQPSMSGNACVKYRKATFLCVRFIM